MKPKPFWLLNHFTVPVVMGDRPLGTWIVEPRASAVGVVEVWREGRQSGALIAARPSRSAETRWIIHGPDRSNLQAISGLLRINGANSRKEPVGVEHPTETAPLTSH